MKNSKTKSYLEIGKDVIAHEMNSLGYLLDFIDNTFEDCVLELIKVKGHIIVTGIGKSGIVGKKIAATFTATGTPAFFMHPVDANHGDLGLLTANNLLLIISKSGNSLDFKDIIDFAKSHQVPIISITANRNSYLAKKSKISLIIPSIAEACSISHTPTTSAIMTLALGDALAISLVKARNLLTKDVAKYHPHGFLGSQLNKN